MKTRIYRLVPTARPDDPNWGRATNQGEVIVRAVSSGDARIVAAYGEAAATTLEQPKGTTTLRASAFRDEKLYTVREDMGGNFPSEGPRKVLQALFRMPDQDEQPLTP